MGKGGLGEGANYHEGKAGDRGVAEVCLTRLYKWGCRF